MPRLGSKKSRAGCQQCKKRRVKCDENKPCANCARYGVECSLLHTPPPTGNVKRTSSRARGASARNTSYDVSASPAPSSNSTPPHNPGLSPQSILRKDVKDRWIEDLELMHHFTAHAHTTIPGPQASQKIWGYSVPQESFKYIFLLDSILSFSAAHLAHINPPRASHYRLLASKHQAAAIAGLNAEISNSKLSPNNCHSLFASASLIVMNAFADPEAYGLKALVDIFTLCRGMNAILMEMVGVIRNGPFADLLKPLPNPPQPLPLLSSFLVDINALAEGSHPANSNTSDHPDSPQAESRKAAEQLRDALQHGIETSGHPALRAVTLWPMKISNDYLSKLRKLDDPTVVTLFRQYCRVLEYAGTDWWFLSGWRNISQQFLLHV